jgi:dTDP-4-amino-4,6-dideoxygalactose transaminase
MKKMTISVPFVDLKAQYITIAEEIQEALADVIQNASFIGGKHVKEFEANFAAFCMTKHCIGVGNGTDALFLALKALGIGPGDEVIVPANTFVATSEAVTLAGARVVFVDCDPRTYNIDVSKIPERVTERTKALIPVHLYGQPANMKGVCQVARDYGLKIIQDCAQAHGAEIEGASLASFGDVLCYSFYPGKNLGAYGDAGAVVTDDDDLANRVRMLANHGRMSKYDHEIEGVNSRLDGIQGAILNVKLRRLALWTEARRQNATRYQELLQDIPFVVPPEVTPGTKHVYHLYVIRTKNRDKLQTFLRERGIATGVHYPVALPNLKAYKYLSHSPEDFPVANAYQNEILSLPMYPELNDEMIRYVAEAIHSCTR